MDDMQTNIDRTNDKLISIIVPCFNEEESIEMFHTETTSVLKSLQGYTYEILYVDDGSKDKTLEILRGISSEDKTAHYISFSRNFGKEAAMYAGFCNAKGDLVAVMDADLQHPPSMLPKMVEMIETEDCDSVSACRSSRKGEASFKSFLSRKFYSVINKISEVELAQNSSDFRLMKRKMVDAIVSMGEHNRFTKGIFSWVGFKTCWLPYENVERVAGETKWSTWKLLKYAINGIINFSEAPLKISTWIGIGSSIVSVFVLIFLVVRRILFGDPVDGWASQTCIMIFIGGIQLLCLGILGEYLAKVYTETKNRPHYIVAEKSE